MNAEDEQQEPPTTVRDKVEWTLRELWREYEDDGVDLDSLLVLLDGYHKQVDAQAVKDLVDHGGHQLRYRAGAGTIYLYDEGGVYKPLDKTGLREFLMPVLTKLNVEFRQLRALTEDLPNDEQKAIWHIVPQEVVLVDNAVDRILDTLPTLFPRAGDLDRLIVNLRNGYLDLRELRGQPDARKLILHPHTPSVFRTSQLPFEYDAQATAPNWGRYLADAVPDQAARDFLQEFVGYLLIPETRFDAALFLVGEGGTGKGTFVSTVRELLGKDNVSDLSLEDLADKYRPSELEGKLANITTEVDPTKPIKEDVFKKIVSGEAVLIERKYQNPVSIKPYVRWVVSANEYPRVADKTGAFYRRCYMVPFDQRFADADHLPEGAKPKNPNLKAKLLKELPGVLNWALDGLARLIKNGKFAVPPEVFAKTREFREHNDPVAQFLAERCDVDTCDLERETPTQELFDAFAQWCRDRGRAKDIGDVKVFGKKVLDVLVATSEAKDLDRQELQGRKTINGAKVRTFKGVRLVGGEKQGTLGPRRRARSGA